MRARPLTPVRLHVVLVALVAGLLAVVPAAVASHAPSIPYLALGDSAAYGWDPVNPPGVFADESFHVGYPEELARRSPLEVTNASCPGETSSHFIDANAADNGCGFIRDNVGLHVTWGEGVSQLEFATAFLAANPDTGLVSVQLGANDLFLCQQPTPAACTPDRFGQVLTTLGANLATVITALRNAGYTGPIVLVGYYALDYRDQAGVLVGDLSRSVLLGLADVFPDVVVADGLSAFEQASRRADGDVCAAGLLIPEGDGCNIHTSPRGDRVMAQAVHRAVDIGALVAHR